MTTNNEELEEIFNAAFCKVWNVDKPTGRSIENSRLAGLRAVAAHGWDKGVRHVHDMECVIGKKRVNDLCPENPFRSEPEEQI